MANEFELQAEVRNDLGKGASRRLRRNAGMVPAIVYGAGKEPVSISIAQNVLHKSCENEAFFAHIINLKFGGDSENAIVKGLQRHPATNRIMHADFLRVRMDQEITVEVHCTLSMKKPVLASRLMAVWFHTLCHHSRSLVCPVIYLSLLRLMLKRLKWDPLFI